MVKKRAAKYVCTLKPPEPMIDFRVARLRQKEEAREREEKEELEVDGIE